MPRRDRFSTGTKRRLVLVRRLLPALLGVAAPVLALLPMQYFVLNGTSGDLLSVLGLVRSAWQTVTRTDPSNAMNGWEDFALLLRLAVLVTVLLLAALSLYQIFVCIGAVFLLQEKERGARQPDGQLPGTTALLRRWFFTVVWGEWAIPLSGLGLLLPLSFPAFFSAIARMTLMQPITAGYPFLSPARIYLILWVLIQIPSFLWRTFEKDLRWTLFDRRQPAAEPAPDEEEPSNGDQPIYVPGAAGEEVHHERTDQDEKYRAYRFDWRTGEYEAQAVQIQKVPKAEDRPAGPQDGGAAEGDDRPVCPQAAEGPAGDGRCGRGESGRDEGPDESQAEGHPETEKDPSEAGEKGR